MDVFQSVFPRHRYVASLRNQIDRFGDTEVVLRDREIQGEVCRVSRIMFEEDQPLIKLAIQRSEVIQIALLF